MPLYSNILHNNNDELSEEFSPVLNFKNTKFKMDSNTN